MWHAFPKIWQQPKVTIILNLDIFLCTSSSLFKYQVNFNNHEDFKYSSSIFWYQFTDINKLCHSLWQKQQSDHWHRSVFLVTTLECFFAQLLQTVVMDALGNSQVSKVFTQSVSHCCTWNVTAFIFSKGNPSSALYWQIDYR